jgi:PmbA protein
MFDEFKSLFARKAADVGLDDWELHGILTKKLQVSLKVGERPCVARSEVGGVAVRVTKRGQEGFAFTERLDEEGAELLAHHASEGVDSMSSGEAGDVFEPGAEYGTVHNFDPRFADEEYVTGVAELANDVVLSMDPSLSELQSSLVTADEKRVFVANSKGVNLTHLYNYATLQLTPVAGDGSKRRESAVFVSLNRNGGGDIESLCARGVETAKGYLTARVPESGKYGVVFRNTIATHLIQGFAIFFCGEQVAKRISLVRERLGQEVVSPALTVVDDPLLPEGIFSCPFDAQGVPARRKVIIENGILRGFLHNMTTAKRSGVESTGNAQRISYNQPLEAAPCNIYVEPGPHTEEELLAMLGDGIYVTRLVSTFHGAGVNAVSGDFSMPARGFRVEGGKKRETLELFTVSGNYYELLRTIRACGDDLVFGPPNMLIPGAPAEFGNYGSPAVLVDGISVAGK